MRHVRQSRKVLLPLARLIGRPGVYQWTGNKAFKRTKGKKFSELARILDDDEFRSFCSVIGFVEINWAMLEQNLDQWMQMVFLRAGGDAITDQLPTGFAAKSKYLTRCFKRILLLARFREDALDVLDRADKLARTRNELTHAVITDMKSSGGKFRMRNFRLKRDATHTIEDLYFEVEGFPNLSLELVHVGRDALLITDRLFKTFG